MTTIPSIGGMMPLAKDLLRFGKQILFWIAILFAISEVAEIIRPGNAVFETTKTILPSIATLVIGYYFGSSTD